MSAEEMAETAFVLLNDLGYSSDREWFTKRIFLTPNNDAFFSVYQFLLEFADPRSYDEKFKFCLPLYDKRREAEFRKTLCFYLQELASNGELVDVPPIKMALFTTPGRNAFLQVLLAVIEWALRKHSSELGIVLPPYNTPEETALEALDFFTRQRAADATMTGELHCEMQCQIELLMSDLAKTEQAVKQSRDEVTKAREQLKITEEDEMNLAKFSRALSEISSMSRSLRRILEIAEHGTPSRDATAMIESFPETLLHAVQEALPVVDELNEQLLAGAVDIIPYMKVIKTILKNRLPLFNDVIEKLSQGSGIDEILNDQRSALQRAKKALNRFRDLIDHATESLTESVRSDFEATGEVLIRAIEPPSLPELEELIDLSGWSLESTANDGALRAHTEAMLPPTETNIRRLRMKDLNVRGTMNKSVAMPTPATLLTPIPRIGALRQERIKRRSIKEVFTSTPFAKSQ